MLVVQRRHPLAVYPVGVHRAVLGNHRVDCQRYRLLVLLALVLLQTGTLLTGTDLLVASGGRRLDPRKHWIAAIAVTTTMP